MAFQNTGFSPMVPESISNGSLDILCSREMPAGEALDSRGSYKVPHASKSLFGNWGWQRTLAPGS